MRKPNPALSPPGPPQDGLPISFVTPEGRSAWFCRHGWLVKDIVGSDPATMQGQCRPVKLAANALFLVQAVVVAGLLAGWAGADAVSSVQLGVSLGVKVVWLQYVLAYR